MVHDALHVNPRCVHLVGSSSPVSTRCSTSATVIRPHVAAIGIEVPGGHSVDQIAGRVALPRLHQRDIGANPALEDVGLPVKIAMFLAFRDRRPHAGSGKEPGDARPPGAHAFGQRSLWTELNFQRSGQELALELAVFAHIARNHLADLPRLEQQSQPPAVHAGVVARDRQVLLSRVAQGKDQRLRNAAEPKAAHRDRHAVFDNAVQRGVRIRVNLGSGQANATPSGTVGKWAPQHPHSSMRAAPQPRNSGT